MDKIYYTRHDGGLSLFKNGRHSTVSSTHPNFTRIVDALKTKRFSDVEDLMNIEVTLNKAGLSRKFKDRKVFVKKGDVFWVDSRNETRKLEGTLVDRILNDLGTPSGGKFADALLLFLDNVQKNKRKDIRAELYEWLMSGKTPITYDGCFLAYKKVNLDYTDIYTGKMDNSPGSVPRMKQDDVDTNRNNTCSVGLHFCSLNYLGSYAGDNARVMIVKVNPRHVFAIPTDYQFQKGRASEYFVVGEYKGGWKNDAFKTSFVDEDSKFTSMPEVEFATGWMRPSLEKLGESYGVVVGGKVLIVERRGRYIPVKSVTDKKKGEYFVDILGTPIDGDPYEMSFTTKSVREAVKIAVRKADKSYKA